MGEAGRARVSADFRLEHMGKSMAGLLELAMSLRRSQPGPVPSLGLGRACAAQAVEYFRLVQLTEQLWNERNGAHPIWNVFNRGDWRVRTYALLRWMYEPLYRRGVKRGGAWYFPLADKLKEALLRPK